MSYTRKCGKCGHRFIVGCPKCLSQDFICEDDKPNEELPPAIGAKPEDLLTGHERDRICNAAGSELWIWLNQFAARHKLTWIEKANILNQCLLFWCIGEGCDDVLTSAVKAIKEEMTKRGRAEREGLAAREAGNESA